MLYWNNIHTVATFININAHTATHTNVYTVHVHKQSITLTIVHVTTLPSDETDMKFKLPSRLFFCHNT